MVVTVATAEGGGGGDGGGVVVVIALVTDWPEVVLPPPHAARLKPKLRPMAQAEPALAKLRKLSFSIAIYPPHIFLLYRWLEEIHYQ
jgi:hypothetical protein